MGDAKLKAQEDAKAVLCDFSAPRLHILKGDRRRLARDITDTTLCSQCGSPVGIETRDAMVVPRAVMAVMNEVVQAATNGKMNRHDGRQWQLWLEAFEEEEGVQQEVTVGAVRWLLKHFRAEEVKIQPGLVQWREAVGDYLEDLSNHAEPVSGA